jgi:hypothetical protein
VFTGLLALAALVLRPQTTVGQTTFDYEDALEKAIGFFDANKCGPNVAQDNVFSWRGPCHTSDAVPGGYHDAGDHVKFGLPQGFSASLLGWALYEYRGDFDRAGLTPKTLRTLKYFTDYFLVAHPNATTFHYQVGDGNADHGYWGPPENQTGARPVLTTNTSSLAADILGQHAGALALMSLNYRTTDAAYANRCLTAARELFTLGQTQLANPACTPNGQACRGQDTGEFYNSSSHFDDMAWGAIWLSIATGDQGFLAPVDGWLDRRNDPGDNPYNKPWTMAWDDMTLGNLLKMHQLTGRTKYRDGLRWNLRWYAGVNQPERSGLQKTPAGLPWLDQWGVLRYASAEAGLGYLANKLFGYGDFMTTGNFIVNYILGSNPRGGSYVTNYLNNPPIHPHHRANEPVRGAGTNGIVGALVGGPQLNDTWVDSVDDFRANEVALDYNASYILALAGRLYFANGGPPGTPPSPPPPPPMSPPANGTGLTGSYFQGTALAGTPLLTRVDPTVNFNLAGGSPGPGVPNDQFSVRWEGEIEARSDEVYTFYVTHDDGARLWVNGVPIVNDWTDSAANEDSGTITLGLGQRYPIRLEFYENGGDAVATLSWSTPLGIEKQVVPQTQLFPTPGTPPTPNFTLAANPSSVVVPQGGTATSTISIARTGGFTGAVALSASGLPAGVSASFNPASATGATSTVTFTASATASTTPATVTVTGTGGGLTRTAAIGLTVSPSQNFTLSAAPASVTVNQGASASSTITITRTSFTGAVSFAATGLPAGVTASFAPASTTGTSSVVTFSASATASTTPATVTITGTSGALSRTTSVGLTVSPGQNFTLSAAPSTLTVNPGASVTSTIAIARTGGFTGAVALSASGLPSGVTASFSPASATGTSSVVTFTASAGATGSGTVTVTGTSGTLTRTTALALTVNSTTGTGGVTVTRAMGGSPPWYNENRLTFANTGTLTAITVTIVVQRTPGITFNGLYNTTGEFTQSNTGNTNASTITYTWTRAAALGAGSGRLFVAQTNGNGTAHPASGDTWTVTYTTGGQTFTQSGTF